MVEVDPVKQIRNFKELKQIDAVCLHGFVYDHLISCNIAAELGLSIEAQRYFD